MKELWTGLVEILTPPSESGNCKAFTNIVAWAEGRDDCLATISRVMENSGIYVLCVENRIPVRDCETIAEQLEAQIERAKMQPEDCVVGTFHYYPSRPT